MVFPFFLILLVRDAYAGGAGGPRLALHIELFPGLLSCEEAFSSGVDSFIEDNSSWSKPQTSNLARYYNETIYLTFLF